MADKDNIFAGEVTTYHPSNKRIYYNKELLSNPNANHSAFMAHLNRCLGYCATYVKTRQYSEEEQLYISWLMATHMCKGQIDKGFPVLE